MTDDTGRPPPSLRADAKEPPLPSLRADAPAWQPRATAPVFLSQRPPPLPVAHLFQLQPSATPWQPPLPPMPPMPPPNANPGVVVPPAYSIFGAAPPGAMPFAYCAHGYGYGDVAQQQQHAYYPHHGPAQAEEEEAYGHEEPGEEREEPAPERVWPFARKPCGPFLNGACPLPASECELVHDPLAAAQLAAAMTLTLDGVTATFGKHGLGVLDLSTPQSRERASFVRVSGLSAEEGSAAEGGCVSGSGGAAGEPAGAEQVSDGELLEVLALFNSSAAPVRLVSRPHPSHATVRLACREDAAAAIADLHGSMLRARWLRAPPARAEAAAEAEAAPVLRVRLEPAAAGCELAAPLSAVEVAWAEPSRTAIANFYGTKRSVAEKAAAACARARAAACGSAFAPACVLRVAGAGCPGRGSGLSPPAQPIIPARLPCLPCWFGLPARSRPGMRSSLPLPPPPRTALPCFPPCWGCPAVLRRCAQAMASCCAPGRCASAARPPAQSAATFYSR